MAKTDDHEATEPGDVADHRPSHNSRSKKSDKEPTSLPWLILAIVLFVAVSTIVVYGLYSGAATFLMVELMLGITSLSVGGFLGFLFGMPQSSVISDEPDHDSSDAALRYRPSTHLGQISDWLTKILIGVGLVEIRQMSEALERMGAFVQRSIEGAPAATNFVSQIIVIAFLVVGFLASFLWTRIFYGPLQMMTDSNVLSKLQQAIAGLKLKVSRQQSETEGVKTVTKMMARGELGPSVSGKLLPTASLSPVEPRLGHDSWPGDVQEKFEKFSRAPKKWDSDPSGDFFGSAPRVLEGYQIEAAIAAKLADALIINLSVRRIDGETEDDVVTFLLHPTLPDRVQYAPMIDGVAEIKFFAEGWFTVVAILKSGSVVLAYDLREIPNVPDWFKEEDE